MDTKIILDVYTPELKLLKVPCKVRDGIIFSIDNELQLAILKGTKVTDYDKPVIMDGHLVHNVKEVLGIIRSNYLTISVSLKFLVVADARDFGCDEYIRNPNSPIKNGLSRVPDSDLFIYKYMTTMGKEWIDGDVVPEDVSKEPVLNDPIEQIFLNWLDDKSLAISHELMGKYTSDGVPLIMKMIDHGYTDYVSLPGEILMMCDSQGNPVHRHINRKLTNLNQEIYNKVSVMNRARGIFTTPYSVTLCTDERKVPR